MHGTPVRMGGGSWRWNIHSEHAATLVGRITSGLYCLTCVWGGLGCKEEKWNVDTKGVSFLKYLKGLVGKVTFSCWMLATLVQTPSLPTYIVILLNMTVRPLCFSPNFRKCILLLIGRATQAHLLLHSQSEETFPGRGAWRGGKVNLLKWLIFWKFERMVGKIPTQVIIKNPT